MSNPKPIKKPTIIWVIIGFAVTIWLFASSIEYIEDMWYLFVLFIIADIGALISYFSRLKAYKQLLENPLDSEEVKQKNILLEKPATIRVVRDSSFVGAIVPYKVYLNNQYAGDIKNGKTLEISTNNSYNIVTVFDNAGNPFGGNAILEVGESGSGEVHVKAGRFVKNSIKIKKA